MFVPCIILNQKKQPSLLPQKSCFDLHICFNPWKHHPQYFQRLGTWFHWVAESIQVPLWWDYLTWSTFSYKFFGRWEEVCDLHTPFFQEKKMFFFCKNAKKNECESHRLLWGRRDGSKNEPWMLELNFADFFRVASCTILDISRKNDDRVLCTAFPKYDLQRMTLVFGRRRRISS